VCYALFVTTQVLVRKLNKEVMGLKNDMRQIKKLLVVSLRDSEGEYAKSFVVKMLGRAQSRIPHAWK
jgi:hypothetical protein